MRPPRDAREAARLVLRRVESEDAYASLALAGVLDGASLSPADRGFATELTYGVLRHRARLDRALAACAPRGIDRLPPPVLLALRVAAYQLLFLRTPAHAAVNDGVSAVRAVVGEKLAGFANALLRRLARDGEPPLPPPAETAEALLAIHSVPAWLAPLLLAAAPGEALALAEALARPAPVALRVSPRGQRDEIAARLTAAHPAATIACSSYLPDALLVRNAGSPEAWDVFQEGLVTIQDVAAQAVGLLVGAEPGERILDACSGVGGKATHLAEIAVRAGGAAQIDAADRSARKLDLLTDSARRLGLDGIRPVVCDLLEGAGLAPAYDRVLLDAPCSGLGVLRRHPELRWRRQTADVAELADLQRRLLEAVAPRVRPGGVLVYSVCTFTAEETTAQIASFRARHPEFVRSPGPESLDPLLGPDGMLHTWPHRHDADAFYVARLIRAT